MRLLPREALLETSEVDHAAWNFQPVLGAIQRTRFRLALALLPNARSRTLLEVGYGSGVFLPELALRAEQVYGVDVHEDARLVEAMLEWFGARARLLTATAARLPFQGGTFDVVVAVSALEFVDDAAAACDEIARVLGPSGVFVVVTPGHSRLVDMGLRVLTGRRARSDFGAGRERLARALTSRFRVDRELRYPPSARGAVTLYRALRLRPL